MENTKNTIHMVDLKLKYETKGKIIIPMCNARSKNFEISDDPGKVTCEHCQLSMIMKR